MSTILSSDTFTCTLSAPTNIACIKYWGKKSVQLNTPINSSVSVTLDQEDLKAVTTVVASKKFKTDRLWLNGVEEDVSNSKRFKACVEGVRRMGGEKRGDNGEVLVLKGGWKDYKVHVSSMNTFPTAAGLASSAAGYAALVKCLSVVFCASESYPGELSTIARQGSGSACRSLQGGFVAWRMGSMGNGSDSMAKQVCNENHWPQMRAIILVVSDEKKDTSSTEGMSTSVKTSELLGFRANSGIVDRRMDIVEKAYKERDFETFGKVTMQDSNQFHATCLDTYPPIFYMNDTSKSVIKIVHAYNAWKGRVAAAYTFDAGPNAVIYCLDDVVDEVLALMLQYYPGGMFDGKYVNNKEAWKRAKGLELDGGLLEMCDKKGRRGGTKGDVKMVYVTRSGPGPIVMGKEESLIDFETGLNRYTKPRKAGVGLGLVALAAGGLAVAFAMGIARKR